MAGAGAPTAVAPSSTGRSDFTPTTGGPFSADGPYRAELEAGQAQANAAAERAVAATNAQVNAQRQAIAQQYYTPAQQLYVQARPQQAQQQTLTLPGFQGVRNPFASAYVPQRAQSQSNMAALIARTNAYNQANAQRMADAKVAQIAQANAMQKAYQDKIAADKAKAEAEASWKAKFGSFAWFAQQDGWTGADGGIADLQKGFKR